MRVICKLSCLRFPPCVNIFPRDSGNINFVRFSDIYLAVLSWYLKIDMLIKQINEMPWAVLLILSI